ncbi:glutamyl-tRNA reductase [Granulicella cerasi]|uniref:Glutamyl-tRNA reductase n=1 Tax=Granulicella cerasi TaxID=741063 RepID=A0ABW1ZF47_9BACT|nr:glutamyl-tRNA reductase [Granulicella cerasi]
MSETTQNKSSLLLVGVNHTTAPLAVRERLAIEASRLGEATRALAHQPGVREALILSTCNRVELITVHESEAETARTLSFLREYLNLRDTDLQPHLYEYRENEAVRHLFRVASSLDSMVVGEPQILGQVKQSWSVAREVGAVSNMLDPLLQRAFSVAKRVRTETQIGASQVSVASVAAELARKIFGSLAGKTVLLVGAGKMSDLAARHLIQQGATTLLVSNRTEARAERMAAELRTPNITTGVIPFVELHERAHRADIIITSTGAGQIFQREHAKALLQRRKNSPMFFIDIAVPRDVAPEVNEIEGCFVYDVDDLQQAAQQNQATRTKEAEAAETIVRNEVERYNQRLAQNEQAGAIRELLAQAELVRETELAKALAKMPQPISDLQREAIEQMTRQLTNKLLHSQITALREGSQTRD